MSGMSVMLFLFGMLMYLVLPYYYPALIIWIVSFICAWIAIVDSNPRRRI